MAFVQIERLSGRSSKVPDGQTPLIELDLRDNQRVITCELVPLIGGPDRKTVDWEWVAYVEADCGPVVRSQPNPLLRIRESFGLDKSVIRHEDDRELVTADSQRAERFPGR